VEFSPKTILVVDDNEQVCSLMASVLRGDGYDVVEAHNGAAALQVLSVRPQIQAPIWVAWLATPKTEVLVRKDATVAEGLSASLTPASAIWEAIDYITTGLSDRASSVMHQRFRSSRPAQQRLCE
jgi:CheY-like chemotaxis protein